VSDRRRRRDRELRDPKLTTRCGTAAVEGCNEALLAKAAEAKLLRTTRLRADTTVVPYPTDSGLPAKAVRRIAAQGRDEAQTVVRRVTGELAEPAERAMADAEKLLVNARRALRRAHRMTAERKVAGRPDLAAGAVGCIVRSTT
jgi:IS5 family transposase